MVVALFKMILWQMTTAISYINTELLFRHGISFWNVKGNL